MDWKFQTGLYIDISIIHCACRGCIAVSSNFMLISFKYFSASSSFLKVPANYLLNVSIMIPFTYWLTVKSRTLKSFYSGSFVNYFIFSQQWCRFISFLTSNFFWHRRMVWKFLLSFLKLPEFYCDAGCLRSN